MGALGPQPSEDRGLAPTSLRAQVTILAFAAALGLIYFFTLARVHLGLADEGFLWYGFQRTQLGELPLRDFQSYEPGRYWVCCLFGWLMQSSGILPVRAGLVAFFTTGVFFALRLVWRHLRSTLAVGVAGLVLFTWAYPIHKLFEHGVALMGVCVAAALLERPTLRRHFFAGLFVGFAGVIGRNHGLYCGLALGLTTLVLAAGHRDRSWLRKLGALVAGTVIGFGPVLALMAFAPGFAAALWESVVFFSEHGTNIPIPVPWPWTVEWHSRRWIDSVSTFAVGTFFCIMVATYAAGLVVLWRTPARELGRRALFLGAVLIGILYSHHASVRSDPWHLAQSIPPLLLALMGLAAVVPDRPTALRLVRIGFVWVLVPLLGAAAATTSSTAWGTLLQLPSRLSPKGKPRTVELTGGESLRLPPSLGLYVAGLQAVAEERIGEDEVLFAAPNKPGVYALLRRRSPAWHTFFLWEATRAEQKQLVEDLEAAGVEWVLLDRLEGDERLHFKNTHGFVWKYLGRNFTIVEDDRIRRGNALMRRREGRRSGPGTRRDGPPPDEASEGGGDGR